MDKWLTEGNLELCDLSLAYPNAVSPLLTGLSLSINRKEIVAILGPSGIGKSSIIRACLGLMPKGSRVGGSVRLDGKELVNYSEEQWRLLRGLKLGWMTQAVATALEPRVRIVFQLAQVLFHLRGLNELNAREALLNNLSKLGVPMAETLVYRRWNELSGGQQRLVLISLWLCVLPEFLFLDEPSVGLDSVYRDNLILSLRSACEATGLSIVIISHDWEFAQSVADRCFILKENGFDETSNLEAGNPPKVLIAKEVSADEDILQVIELKKSFRQSAGNDLVVVNGLNYSVKKGQVLVFWGRSGSGKTTAAHCTLRLLESNSGKVLFHGVDLLQATSSDLCALRKHIQLVEQDAHSTIDPKWTVHKIITEGTRWYKLDLMQEEERIKVWMRLIGLHFDISKRYGGELSIGEAQRVAIVRALMLQPEILILDEPSANLDHLSREKLIDCVKSYLSQGMGGILLISHDYELVKEVGNEIVDFNQMFN